VSSPGPPAGVAEALEVLSRAFSSRDLEAALACFADDDSVVYSGSEVGEVAAGRDELRSLFVGLFARESAYSWDVTELWSSSRGDLALVTAEAVGHSRNGNSGEDFAYRLTGVLSCGPDGCRWLQLHGAEPTASDD
jgi:ketosteroid isomerase-like protein